MSNSNHSSQNRQYASVFELNGVPKFGQALPLALQHVVAMIVGCVTPAIIVSGVAGLNERDQVILVQAALFTSAISTLLQLFPFIRFKNFQLGSALPVIMGISFAYVPSMQAIAEVADIGTILGAQIVGGIVAILVGFGIRKIRILFPPIVTGTVVFTIGLSLYPTAINYMAGGTSNPDYGSWKNWLAAFFTLAVVTALNHFAKGFLKLASILIGIIVSSLLGIPMGVTVTTETVSFAEACSQLPSTFGAIFTSAGLPSLFADPAKVPLVLITIFSFSLSDTFDTIGTFIGTGRRTGIFSDEDEHSMETTPGFKSKMDRALFADATATSIGAILGTSNTTTYVESAAGIGAGGRTGLTSVVVAVCFAVSAFLATFVSAIPFAATAPALVVVGIMMLSAFREIQWDDFSEAVPAFFAGIFMALCYSISYGIAAGFVFYCITKVCKKQAKEVHPILWVATVLFVLNFVLLANL